MSNTAWIDLAEANQQAQEIQADFCVIGAGAAGIYLAMQLARRGHAVVVLEAGPAVCVDAGEIGFDAVFEAAHYPGATAGRFFGMGGSTSRWGGALVPHTEHDLREEDLSAEGWRKIVGTVAANAPQVLQRLGYRNGWDFESAAAQLLGKDGQALGSCGIHAQSVLYLPFRRKNLVGLLDSDCSPVVTPRVFLNAVAKSWVAHAGEGGGARIARLVAVSRNGKELAVSAESFVVAAGAIESARILLEIDESGSQPVLPAAAAVGCYLADHLSVAIADVPPRSLARAINLFAPRFSGAWMRKLRFLELRSSTHVPRAFAHFVFANSSPGFELAKEILGAMQNRRIPAIRGTAVAAGTGDLIRLAYHRFARSRLYIPDGTPAHLQLDMEQVAARENHVRLAHKRDAYGRRLASIHWQVSETDMTNILDTARRFLSRWPGDKAELPELQPRVIGGDGTKPYDAYHPVGTCRLGEDPEAVVDLNLKVCGMENLWSVSTGVLPSAGTANPTFTMLCLTHQLAEQLSATH